MGLTRLAIRRPLTMLMIVLGLIILGLNGYTLLKVDRYPEINLPFVATIVIYPGASPTDIETDVIKPIEDAVAGVFRPGLHAVYGAGEHWHCAGGFQNECQQRSGSD